MNKIRTFLLSLFLLIVSINALPGQSSRYENQVIDYLNITVNDATGYDEGASQKIQRRMKTRIGDIFSQADFDSDLKMLSDDYDRIEPNVSSVNGIITIDIKVWANPTIRNIFWRGNKSFPCTKLIGELGIPKGSTFSRQKFNKGFNKVKNFYVEKGFFEAQIDYTVDHDTDCNEVDITICIDEGRAGKVKEVCFKNFEKCEITDLSNIILTKKYNLFLSWMSGQGYYNEEMIQHDEFMVLNYLQNKGYADAQVCIDVTEAKDCDKIIVTITADRGDKYKIGRIHIEGNELYTDAEIFSCLRIFPNGPYSPERLGETIRQMTNKYGRCGYIEAIINYETIVSDDDPFTYNINITVSEGESFCVGMIKVFGNCSTQTKVILHETLLVPGETFNLERLQSTEARLRNIGYFKNVNVYAVKSEETKVLPGNYRDVHIEVEEASTGNVGAFAGFSNQEKLFGGFNISEKNFNIAGLRTLNRDGFRGLRGGGEYAHITLNFGSKTNSYVLSWTKPHYLDTPWTVGFDIDRTYTNYISDAYDVLAYGLTLHASYDYNAFVRVGTHYRLRNSETDFDETKNCKNADGTNQINYDKAKQAQEKDGLISAVGLNWYYDSTNHPLFPTNGFKSRLMGEIAGLGGDESFVSVAYLNSYFVNLWGCGTLKLRGDARFIQTIGSTNPHNLPIDERLFLGGDNTIRGYRPYRLGDDFLKWDCEQKKYVPDPDSPRGGVSLQVMSAEFSKPFLSRFMGFVFADAGAVSLNKWTFGPFYYSVGYGCHVQIFDSAPPLTIGMGYPLNPDNSSDVKRFFITLGGKF